MDTASFGRWLQQRRKDLDLTQAAFAEQVGCTAATIQKIEANIRRPSRQIAERLATLLEIPPADRAAFIAWARHVSRPGQPLPPIPGVDTASNHALPEPRQTLPIPPTPLIGREQEVAALRTMLLRDEVRLVTLTGAPGIGKTRLALQVVADLQHTFADGAFFVALAPIRDLHPLATTIARTFGVHEVGDRPLVELLAEALRNKQILMVLDNFEHLLNAAPLLAELLATCPRLKLLITSRARLHLSGEYEVVVSPLALPDLDHLPPTADLARYSAVALFVQRAQAIKADFRLTDANRASIAAICIRLDGLPLAIELAATRSKLFTPQALLARLDDRLAVLTGGPRDLPDRQQTLRDAIAWSYDLLDASEQALFRRLAVFAGGCTLEAAETICTLYEAVATNQASQSMRAAASPTAILDGLASLIDKSLLKREDGTEDEPRFTMLATIREYALEQLERSGESRLFRQQHVEYYVKLAETAEPQLFEEQQGLWLARLEREHGNLRTALQWAIDQGQSEIAARLGKALWWFWLIHGHLSEGRRWLAAILERGPMLSAAIRADLLNGAAGLANEQGDYAAAQSLLEQSLALHQALNNQMGIASTLGNLGLMAYVQGDYLRATSFHEESLILSRELGDQRGVARTLSNLGTLAYTQREYQQATAYFMESLALLRKVGDVDGIASSLTNLGLVTYVQGDGPQAAAHFAESLAMYQQLGRKQGIGLCLAGLAGVAGACGQPELAARLSGATTALLDAIGVHLDPIDQANYEDTLAAVRAQLDPATFAAAWAEGQAMPLEQAIAEAMGGIASKPHDLAA